MKKTLLTLLLIMVLFSCNSTKKDTILVVSTTSIIHNTVQNIAGNLVSTKSLMGPGIDPHLYKASAGDIALLNNADIIFYNGLHLEAKMADILKKLNAKKPTIAIGEVIPESNLLAAEDYDGFHDPHVWFDVQLWVLVTKEITKQLIKIAPQHKASFLKNESNYISQLLEMDQWIKEQVSLIPNERKRLVTAHDAFGYFSKRYGIHVIGLQGISTAMQANTKDIQDITNTIIKHNVPTIFIESSVPVRQIEAVQAAVQAKGHSVKIGKPLFTDALGSAHQPEGTYIGMMKYNTMQIVNGLK
ncbi:MAG: metal ABC transporter solute-binding protein, Zn/Mn family [Candidatus Marinamargulisbacteria bacterium]